MSRQELEATIARLVDDDDYHRTISINAAARFREVVDFDGEREQVRQMLEGVL